MSLRNAIKEVRKVREHDEWVEENRKQRDAARVARDLLVKHGIKCELYDIGRYPKSEWIIKLEE
jgi:hypothetical protein